MKMQHSQKSVPSIRHKIILGFGLAVMMLAVFGGITYHTTRDYITAAQWRTHSWKMLEVQQSFLQHLKEADNGVRDYVVSSKESDLKPFVEARTTLPKEFKALELLSADRPSQKALLEGVRKLISDELALLTRTVETKQRENAAEAETLRHQGVDPAEQVLADGDDQARMTGIKEQLLNFEENEQHMLMEHAQKIEEIGDTTTLIIILATMVSVVFLILAGYFILRDISARRQAEEALAEEHNLFGNIMDALPDQVFVKDMEGRFVIDNIAHRKFLGAKAVEDVEGKRESDFFPPDAAKKYDAIAENVIQTGQPVINHEEVMVEGSGKIIWLSMTKLPLRDTDGKMIGIVGVSASINERKESEEKLRMTAAQLQRSNNELQEFASVASHDLQEPLRKIQAFGDRLKLKCGSALGEIGNDYLERMQDAARRMQTLLHDLLTLSRVTSKAQPFQEVNIGEVVRQVVSDLEVRIEQLGARIEIENLPKVEVDASQMRQLFQNLISNALKFQRPGVKPEVIISSRILEDGEQTFPACLPGDKVCRIFVQDNGIGFDEKYAERIFTVFQRLHSRSEYEGTGIGLAVVRKIMERHGGTVTAKSSEGDGATFIVTLPLKQRIKETNE